MCFLTVSSTAASYDRPSQSVHEQAKNGGILTGIYVTHGCVRAARKHVGLGRYQQLYMQLDTEETWDLSDGDNRQSARGLHGIFFSLDCRYYCDLSLKGLMV